MLNSLERPNSSITLRKILLNVTVKYVTDKLKLINEKKNFLLPPNVNVTGSGNVTGNGNVNGNVNVNVNVNVNGNVNNNPQVKKFENFKKIALSVAAEPRRSGRVTKRPTQPEGMLTGSNATAALNRANRNAEENKRRRAAIEESKSQSALEVLSNAKGKLENLSNRVNGSEQGPPPT